MKIIILVISLVTFIPAFAQETLRGKELLEINKFDAVIKQFAESVEKGETQQAMNNFLRILKLKPNKEIIRKIS